MNMLKTAALMTGLTLILVYGGAYLGGRSGMTTALMFIVSPLSGKGFANLFSAHPPMEERVARLESMSRGN